MKRTFNLVQYGLGNVGLKLLELIDKLNKIRNSFALKLIGAADSGGGVFNIDGIEIGNLIEAKKDNCLGLMRGYQEGLNDERLIELLTSNKITDCIVIDVTASENTLLSIKKAIKSSYHVVVANKKPLTQSYDDFKEMRRLSRERRSKFLFECTVGSGLPVIYAVKSLLDTNDRISQIEGCFSGSLGFLFSELEKKRNFSGIVLEAKELGYWEPDPRDDLSGMDVARKALILARMMGYELEMSDIEIESLVPDALKGCSVEEFMSRIQGFDNDFNSRISGVISRGNTLRYVASIRDRKVIVGIREFPLGSRIGGLKGTENICVIYSERYRDSPLVIQGPGAGLYRTADGVLRNILECCQMEEW